MKPVKHSIQLLLALSASYTANVQFASLASEKPVTSQCPATIDQGETDG